MKNLTRILVVIAPLALVLAAFAAPRPPAKSEKKASAAAVTCPVMGDPVNLFVKTDTPKGPVYFCCSHCIDKFKDSPAKYTEKADEQRKLLAMLPRVQLTCPVTGDPINEKVSAEHKGQKIYFCCDKCKAPYEKDPAKYQAKLEASYTYQTRCPVSGEPISRKATTTLKTGEKVYFCCDKCAAKFTADPPKFAPKLAEQGYELKLDKE